jgi:putative nucleotide binding protein
MEDYAWVIEYMPSGHAAALRKEPAVQLMGTRFFTLLEATVVPNATIVVGQKVNVGKEGRQEVSHIKGRIKYDDLTNGAKEFLPSMVKRAVMERENDFVAFINNAKPISIRVHTLDLLPGIGKKNMEALLKERDVKPFESFAEIHKRVPTLADPSVVFVHRILSELQGSEKYYLFTKPPFVPHQFGGPHQHMGQR